MYKAWAVAGVLAAGLALAADVKDDAAKKELEKFNGTWQAISITHDGKEASKDEIAKVTLTVKGDHYTLRTGDNEIEGTHKLDPTTTPKQIEAVRTKGENKDKPMLGIYELTEESFKVCFAAPGKDRPTDFSAKEDSGNRLIVMKREKR